MKFINKDLNLTYYNQPYPYLVIENFFKKEFYDIMENKFPKIEDFKKQKNNIRRMNYDTSVNDNLYENLIKNIKEFKELHNYIYSKEFLNYFINLFKKDIEKEINKNNLKNIFSYNFQSDPYEVDKIISKKDLKDNHKNDKILYPRLDLGMGILGYGKNTGGKGIHVDNPQRLISILLYFGGFESMTGGELRIWRKEKDNLVISNVIKPKPNSLVASLQSNISFHDVNPVTEIIGTRNACYIAISSNDKIWKEIELNEFNQKYHKNRLIPKYSFIREIKNIFK